MKTKTVMKKMTPFTDEYFMKQALAEAHTAAAEGEVPVGAVVVCSDRMIARAHNQTERLNDPTAHAEMLAITAAVNALGAKYLTECALYVTVEPCVMCAGAIGWAQIGTLVYGASDEKRGYRQYAAGALHPKTLVRDGILENECAEAMQTFFRNKR
jgi:tRNA(adenine34) deaminase